MKANSNKKNQKSNMNKNLKNTNNKKQKSITKNIQQYSANWFYMTTQDLDIKDIKNIFTETEDIQLEIWEEAQILEISLKDAKSIDIEKMKGTFYDEEGKDFLLKNSVKTIYLVTIDPDHFNIVKNIMKEIVKNLGGFFCEDVEELKPFNL